MPAFFGPGGQEPNPFDDFLARVFGASGEGAGPVRRIDLTRMLNQQAQQVLADAARYASEQGHEDLDALHLLRALSRHDGVGDLLRRQGADPEVIGAGVAEQLPARNAGASATTPALTTAAKRALVDAHQVARAFGASYIGPEHILLALVANGDAPAAKVLAANGVTPEALQAADGGAEAGSGARNTGTPTLDQFGQDLTKRARNGELDPVIGRAVEIEQTLEILSRRTKNNPVLIGEAGVGKTAIVDGIAQRIVDGDVPELLADKRIVALELSGMLAGTRYRGDFEERMTKVIDEIVAHRDELIVFIDELHTVVGAGGAEGAIDAGNMLKPRLARGELHILGATTLGEYRKNIEQDPALERRFQPVNVDE
ncbi:MAG: Clp protease N-terminal domain-containing protein, partial [Sciscionella sp.]